MRSRPPTPRDTERTAFATIMEALIARVPGAYACTLVDQLGESVDYAGCVDPFDARIAAAHLRIVLDHVDRFAVLGAPRWIIVLGRKGSAIVRALPEGYALVVLLRRRAGFTASERAFAACEYALSVEAGWLIPADRPIWRAVEVETNARGRPARIGPSRVDVEVLGSILGLSSRERGYRVRTADGTELNLVREPLRQWYSDEWLP